MTGVLKNFAGCMQSMLRKYINSLMVYIFRDTSIDSVLELPFLELSLESLWYERFNLDGANGLIIWFSRAPFEVRTCVCKYLRVETIRSIQYAQYGRRSSAMKSFIKFRYLFSLYYYNFKTAYEYLKWNTATTKYEYLNNNKMVAPILFSKSTMIFNFTFPLWPPVQ